MTVIIGDSPIRAWSINKNGVFYDSNPLFSDAFGLQAINFDKNICDNLKY